MNKSRLKLSNLLTRLFLFPILGSISNPIDMHKIKSKLKDQISRDIQFKKRLLEKRAFAHAQAIFPVGKLTLEPPDYGVGVIPKLTAVDNTNFEAIRIIDECNDGIIKLSIMLSLLTPNNALDVLKCLTEGRYYTMSVEEVKHFMGSTAPIEDILLV